MLTFFSIYSIVGQSTAFASIAIGVALMILVYAGGHISGGHFNPSVTIGVLMASKDQLTKKDLIKALLYIILQLLGGLIGAFISVWLTDTDVTPAPGVKFSTGSGMKGNFFESCFNFLHFY